MIKAYICTDPYDRLTDNLNEALVDLQNKGYKIIDIKFTSTSVVGNIIHRTNNALIIYDDGIIPEEDRVLTAAELGIK